MTSLSYVNSYRSASPAEGLAGPVGSVCEAGTSEPAVFTGLVAGIWIPISSESSNRSKLHAAHTEQLFPLEVWMRRVSGDDVSVRSQQAHRCCHTMPYMLSSNNVSISLAALGKDRAGHVRFEYQCGSPGVRPNPSQVDPPVSIPTVGRGRRGADSKDFCI